MNTNARMTAWPASAPSAVAARCGWRSACLALGAAVAVLRPAHAQEARATSPDRLGRRARTSSSGPSRCIPTTSSRLFFRRRPIRCKWFKPRGSSRTASDDSSLQPDEEWDDSIVALLNYPEVVELLNDDLDWTYDLGTAVLNQRADVLNAIQDFRDQAYAAGNLRTDDRQTVARDDGAIAIKPANPQVIYVPYYEPERVVVYQPVPVYHYYPRRYPVYYYPYPAHYAFDTGFSGACAAGSRSAGTSHHVHVYDPFYHSHPYYGWSYYDPFYSA